MKGVFAEINQALSWLVGVVAERDDTVAVSIFLVSLRSATVS